MQPLRAFFGSFLPRGKNEQQRNERARKIVRTKLSNYRWFVVHFFGSPQRSEPKKTCIGGRVPLCTPSGCACSVRVGLKLLGRWLRRSRDVWRFRLRNDAGKAARQTRRFDAVETLLQLLSLGAERMPDPVGRGLAPAATPRYPLVRRER